MRIFFYAKSDSKVASSHNSVCDQIKLNYLLASTFASVKYKSNAVGGCLEKKLKAIQFGGSKDLRTEVRPALVMGKNEA